MFLSYSFKKQKQSQLPFSWDGDPGPQPHNNLERSDNAQFAFFTLHSVHTRVSGLHHFATRPPSCTSGIEICHRALGPRNETTRNARSELPKQERQHSEISSFFQEVMPYWAPHRCGAFPIFLVFSSCFRLFGVGVADAANLVDGFGSRRSTHFRRFSVRVCSSK